jgi:hypothetical protein
LIYDRSGRYRIVTASITQDQAGIVFSQIVRLIEQNLWLKNLVVGSVRSPHPKIEFGNGAMIESRSTQNRGEYLLGNDYDLFIFDEVAFETDPEYVVENVIQMRLADREGRLDLVSTPNGKNWLYRRVQELVGGKRGGYFQAGDSRENSFISKAFLDMRVKYFSEQRLQQNIRGQFVDAGGEILRGDYVDQALARGAAGPAFDSVDNRPYYISGWDLARKQTATVGITIEYRNGFAQVVALERFRLFDWNVIVEKIKQRQQRYPGRLVVDGTGLGDVVVEQLSEFAPEAVIFSPASKAEMLTNVELFHARHQIGYERWELPDGPGKVWSFEDELRQARWDDNNRCDSLMALALALWPLRKSDKITAPPRIGLI